MQKQIIVYINPFNIQQHAVDYAVGIARYLDLPLLLYSVQEYAAMPVTAEPSGHLMTATPTALPPDWEKTMVEKAKNYRDKIKKVYPNTTHEHAVGLKGDAVVDKVRNLHRSLSGHLPYLLVMPRTSEHNWWNDVMGTAETTVAAETPCPVLFVPAAADFHAIKRVLYLADEESLEEIAYPGFNFLRGFAEKMDTKITVGFLGGELSTQKGYDVGAAMQRLHQSLPHQENYEFRFFSDMDADDLLTIAKITSMDIVAFPFRESSFLSRFFDNEITRTLMLKAESPVLVF